MGRFAVGLKKGPKVNGANRAPSGTAKPQGTAAGGSTAPKKASSTDDVVRQSLERRLKDTLAEYEVAMRQASYALDDVTRMRLEKSAEARLADAKRIEREIDEIGE